MMKCNAERQPLKINFVLPPSPRISGGPLAILEYANRLKEKGHSVTITTYPNTYWSGENPFPWFKFSGEIRFRNDRTEPQKWFGLGKVVGGLQKNIARIFSTRRKLRKARITHKTPLEWMLDESDVWVGLIDAMPECDINIATLWSTAFPVYFSGKGKPVYFMQHYEEIFYPMEKDFMLHKLAARMSYTLPIYKIANSSWLQGVLKEKFGQTVPFSNNGIELADFSPKNKTSDTDGILRIVTFSRPEQWKGFADAAAVMQIIHKRYSDRVQWHVFGYKHNDLVPDNQFAPYTYHPNLPFSELAALYASCDIALCTSWYESFPLPALEAMASGTAVVTTKFGTEDYAFNEVNALVTDSRDIAGMVDAVMRLIEDGALRGRLAIKGRETAEAFNWDNAVNTRESLLYEIHENNVGYDVHSTAMAGLRDFDGTDFERTSHQAVQQACLVKHNGHVFLLFRGTMHHVADANALHLLEGRGVQWITLNILDLARIPRGAAITSAADIPVSQ